LNRAERRLKWLIRIVGIVFLLAIVPAVMPHCWLVWAVKHVEPDTRVWVLLSYLARATSGLVVVIGGLLLIFSTDVRRYAEPIRLIALLSLLPPVLFVIHGARLMTRRPGWFFWYIAADLTIAFLLAVWILVLQRAVAKAAAAPPAPDS